MERNIEFIVKNNIKDFKKSSIPEEIPELIVDINSADHFVWTDYINKNIFSMTPRSVMSDLQILEYFFVNNSCENCLTYHIDRFYNIALINSEIENTPTAEKIRMNTYNATIKQSEIPKKTDAIKDIQMFLKTLKAKDYDNVSRYQTFFDFDVALDIFSKNDGDIYPLPKTFQKQPHMMFMSLFLIKEIHKRDNMIFRAIREKFNSK